MNNYEEELEKQNDELRSMLAAAQKDSDTIGNNIYMLEEVWGTESQHYAADLFNPVLAFGIDNLELYIRKLGADFAKSLSTDFLGYCIRRPSKYILNKKIIIRPRYRSMFFNENMRYVEGFKFNKESETWEVIDSGNCIAFNAEFVQNVENWFREGIIK